MKKLLTPNCYCKGSSGNVSIFRLTWPVIYSCWLGDTFSSNSVFVCRMTAPSSLSHTDASLHIITWNTRPFACSRRDWSRSFPSRSCCPFFRWVYARTHTHGIRRKRYLRIILGLIYPTLIAWCLICSSFFTVSVISQLNLFAQSTLHPDNTAI